MLIKEDYFKDLEITDDVIKNDDIIINSTESDRTPTEWFEYYNTHYSDAIVLYIDSTVHPDKLTKILNDFAKHLNYMLEQYGIEYSDIILRDDSICYGDGRDLYMYDYNGYKLFTIREAFDEAGIHNLYYYRYYTMYVVIYVTFPEYPVFSYRRAYNFIQSLMSLVWQKSLMSSYVDKIKIQKPGFNLNGFIQSNRDTLNILGSDMNNLEEAELIDGKIKNLPGLFKATIKYFFGECDDLFKMLKKIRRGRNPFK